MNRPLRQRHRTLWWLLAVSLPLGMAASLRARAPQPTNAEVPTLQTPAGDEGDEPMQLTFQRDDLWGSLPLRTSVLTASTRHFLELQPLRDLRRPDVLVYWLPDASLVASSGTPAVATSQDGAGHVAGDATSDCSAEGHGVPSSARLLGGLQGRQPRRFALPTDADLGRGAVLLYSLGHQQWLGTARLPGQSDAG